MELGQLNTARANAWYSPEISLATLKAFGQGVVNVASI
jgi:hypothetical protein